MNKQLALSIVSVLALVQSAPSMAATNSPELSITVDAQGRPLVGGKDVSAYLTGDQIEHGKKRVTVAIDGNCQGCHCPPKVHSSGDIDLGSA